MLVCLQKRSQADQRRRSSLCRHDEGERARDDPPQQFPVTSRLGIFLVPMAASDLLTLLTRKRGVSARNILIGVVD